MDLTMILTVGKYAIIAALYAFVLIVFRGIMSQLVAESQREQSVGAGARSRRRRPSRERRAAPVAPEPAPTLRPEPQPAAERPSLEPEAPPEIPEQPEPAVLDDLARPEPSPSRIDLLGEEPDASEPEPQPAPEVPEPEQPPHLLVLESGADDREEGEAVLLSAAVTIGRSDENSLQISDRFISSRHALLRLQDGRRILMDRDSKNGTFVNGERIEGEVELSDGDRIAMGNTVLEYHG